MAKEELPVDKGWAWAVCGAVFIITFLLTATGQMISVTLLDLVVKYDTNLTTVSLMFMFQIAATSVCSILATNFMVPRFGIRRVSVVSAFVTVFASIIFTVSPSIYLCIFLYLIKGACNGLIAIPAISILGFYFNKHRSIATSLAMCGVCSGSIAYPPFVRYILGIFGLQGTYLICSAIEAHMIFACLLIRPVSMYRLPAPPTKKTQDPEDTNSNVKDDFYEMKNNGSMELISYDVEEGHNSQGQVDDATPDSSKHLYQKKNGVSKDTSHHVAIYKPRSISLSADGEPAENSPKDSLLNNHSSSSKDNVNNHNHNHNHNQDHVDFSSKERISRMRETYRTGKSASVNSDEALLQRRRMLKDGQRPSLWSLASNPSMLGIPQEPEIAEVEEDEQQTTVKKRGRWAWVDRIFAFSLFKQWPFVWMLIAAVPCGTNQLIFLYLPTIGVFRGVTKDQAALLLTIMGSVDLVSRLVIGVFADKKLIRISSIIGFSSVCLGIVALFIDLYTDLTSLIIMAVCLGFFVGIRMSLGTVMFIEIVGLEKMAKAFSIYAMFLTLSGAVHNPLLSRMMETVGVPSMMYYLSFTFILSGVMVWTLPLVMRAEKACAVRPDPPLTT